MYLHLKKNALLHAERAALVVQASVVDVAVQLP